MTATAVGETLRRLAGDAAFGSPSRRPSFLPTAEQQRGGAVSVSAEASPPLLLTTSQGERPALSQFSPLPLPDSRVSSCTRNACTPWKRSGLILNPFQLPVYMLKSAFDAIHHEMS